MGKLTRERRRKRRAEEAEKTQQAKRDAEKSRKRTQSRKKKEEDVTGQNVSNPREQQSMEPVEEGGDPGNTVNDLAELHYTEES